MSHYIDVFFISYIAMSSTESPSRSTMQVHKSHFDLVSVDLILCQLKVTHTGIFDNIKLISVAVGVYISFDLLRKCKAANYHHYIEQ